VGTHRFRQVPVAPSSPPAPGRCLWLGFRGKAGSIAAVHAHRASALQAPGRGGESLQERFRLPSAWAASQRKHRGRQGVLGLGLRPELPPLPIAAGQAVQGQQSTPISVAHRHVEPRASQPILRAVDFQASGIRGGPDPPGAAVVGLDPGLSRGTACCHSTSRTGRPIGLQAETSSRSIIHQPLLLRSLRLPHWLEMAQAQHRRAKSGQAVGLQPEPEGLASFTIALGGRKKPRTSR